MRISSEGRGLSAIQCEKIGKRYRLGQRDRYQTLRDAIVEIARAPFRRLAPQSRTNAKDPHLWALKDVSLDIAKGEILGIIGRNGSGKSTLLKVISRITRPTTGQVTIWGRVGTLLEVGAGFHPELTGRENIFLNGSLLGMRRKEIEGKFDEIVEFSGCGLLLDTAIKHYSSGMYVRLAFAVAAHLETEILIVDEVLAVGDAAFQKKCLGKIGDVATQGRTVLFASHNMVAVEGLCTKVICLNDGEIVMQGAAAQVTSSYLQKWLPKFKEVVYEDIASAPGDDHFRLRKARIVTESTDGRITVRDPFQIEFEYWKLTSSSELTLAVEVFNEHGINVFSMLQPYSESTPAGLLRCAINVPGDLLNNGTYWVHLTVLLGGTTFVGSWEDLLAVEIHDAPSELRGFFHDFWPGAVRPNLQWTTELIDSSVPASKVS